MKKMQIIRDGVWTRCQRQLKLLWHLRIYWRCINPWDYQGEVIVVGIIEICPIHRHFLYYYILFFFAARHRADEQGTQIPIINNKLCDEYDNWDFGILYPLIIVPLLRFLLFHGIFVQIRQQIHTSCRALHLHYVHPSIAFALLAVFIIGDTLTY